ncbi:carbohydrate ABC transporter permease [Staphylothermus hellenicus]|uniref:Binding-protein-dependent transport systems inner membrane component n=1 Tax=Staphylothermus hellenicus (strain DSM 12710 / JCM 10830 / BK20S6-10-b1 / P8) TaxID=591019 RepID=D7D9X6_STAHD|nr:sugar ABC transporter permease [Staphylothermus hellenicus]ADI32572.1 binding-protein-dependent transport systems inner membrane component [Staphylothermus hellenicus DSM 12710]
MPKLVSTRDFILFLGPIILITAVLYYMIGETIYVSMSDWWSMKPSFNFVGLENFRRAISTQRFWIAFRNNIIWILIFVIPTSFLGLVIAYLMVISGKETIFRTVFLIPTAMSMVVSATIWVWIYGREGAINTILNALGFRVSHGWIDDPKTALYALIFVTVWLYLGFAVVIFEATIKSIDKSIIEAAKIDGASDFKIFYKIILPLSKSGFLVSIPLLSLAILKLFDLVFVATRGGPGLATDVLANYMWDATFSMRFIAYGAAIAVVIFGLSLVIVIPYALTALRRWFGE